MKKSFSLLVVFFMMISQAYAGPFDVLRQNMPDFVVSDIGQDANSGYLTMKICNIGNPMTDSGDLTIGLKGNFSGGFSKSLVVEDVRFDTGECEIYQITSANDLGVRYAGTVSIRGAVKLSNYTRLEANQNNNITTKDVYVNVNGNQTSYNRGYVNPPLPYIPVTYPNSNSNYGLGDLIVKDVNYFDTTTVYDRSNSVVLRNAVVADICNLGSSFYYGGTIRVKFEIGGKTDYQYLNNIGNWNAGDCRKTWSSVNNFNISYNSNIGVGVTIDDTSVISEINRNNNYLYKGIYFPNVSGNYYNYSGNSYYCNGSWTTYPSGSNGYYCNGTWYNRNVSNNYNYNNYSNTQDTTYNCNGRWYTFAVGATGYYCNGTWFDRNSGNNYNYNNYSNSNGYNCNGTWYNLDTNSSGYYCNGTWYNKGSNNNNNYNSSNGYYCNGNWYGLNSNATGYYCNGTWYIRNSTGNNNSNSNGYYCDGNWHTLNSNATGFNCNGTWHQISTSHTYYCDGLSFTSTDPNGYYCEGVWHNY